MMHTRASSEEQLLSALLERLDRALSHGTTVMEAKSGYGLDLETEVKMLRVLNRAKDIHPVGSAAGDSFCATDSAAERGDEANPQALSIARARYVALPELLTWGHLL